MALPRTFIDEVRRSVDPIRVVGEVVSLKKRGARHVGLCPFHQEKTPSFSVNDEGLWYCFGCGTGGDIFQFVQEQEAVGFHDAVRSLAERAGLQMPEPERRRPEAEGPRIDRKRLLEILGWADAFYREALESDEAEIARDLLAERGFDDDLAERFGLGYAPDSWDALRDHLRDRGVNEREAEAAGLVKRRDGGGGTYDRLRRRIVFPIRDLRGRTVSFGGRVIDRGEPKYLNGPETDVFHKSRTLYGLSEGRDSIKERGFALLVEGYFDLLACAQYGFRNAVAPLGTSFTESHAQLLARFARKVVVNFDGDAAGLAAAERTAGLFLGQGFQVNVVVLPDAEDPDSFLRAEGKDAYVEALRGSQSALEFLVHRAGERADLDTPRGKAEALGSLLEFVVPITDVVERAEWIGRLAERLDLAPHLVEKAAQEVFSEARGRAGRDRETGPAEQWREAMSLPPTAERDLLRAVLEQPDWLDELLELCSLDDLADPRVAGLLAAARECLKEGEPVEASTLLGRCDDRAAAALLSRLELEDGVPLDWRAARNCALGIKDDAVRRRLRRIKKEIEDARTAGDRERLRALNAERLELVRQLPEVVGTRDDD